MPPGAQQDERPLVSVVIPAHDASATIGAQLRALAGQHDAPAFEVVVVANRCVDDTAAKASAAGARVVVADELASAAYARNAGVAAARADLLLFCDADDVVDDRWVAELARPLVEGTADIVGGRIVVDRAIAPAWLVDCQYRWLEDEIVRHRAEGAYVVGASMGVTRRAFDAAGRFDAEFEGAASEEVDLCLRALRLGLRIAAAPDAVVSYSPRSTVRAAMRQFRAYMRAGAALRDKDGLLAPPASRAAVVVRFARGAAHQVVRRRERRPYAVLYAGWMEAVRLHEHRARALRRQLR